MQITVYGVPRPQPRAKSGRRRGRTQVYDPGGAAAWKTSIAIAARGSDGFPLRPLDGAVRVDATFYLPRPADAARTADWPGEAFSHTTVPDRDNLDKAVLDALVRCGVLRDDSRVCQGCIEKLYVERGGAPRAEITAEEIHHEEHEGHPQMTQIPQRKRIDHERHEG